MNSVQASNPNHSRTIWTAVALALTASLSYILMAFNFLGLGDLQVGEKPVNIIFVAAGCYLLGGLLILTSNRWLLLSERSSMR